jgi:hypothetical protein
MSIGAKPSGKNININITPITEPNKKIIHAIVSATDRMNNEIFQYVISM